MNLALTAAQAGAQAAFRDFAGRAVAPRADEADRDERLPPEVVAALAEGGYLGALCPREAGGGGMDAVTFGLLNEELGRACASARSLITVHSMVAFAVGRWGGARLREAWLPRLARGEVVAAFALTEPGAGSDASSLQTEAAPAGDGYVLRGTKKWISFGQIADVFLVFARAGAGTLALLVGADAPGLSVKPIRGLLGARASMLAELTFDGCAVPASQRVGGAGFGCPLVAASALDWGRYSVAWGCVGAAQACLDASVAYTRERVQYGRRLEEFQLVRRMVSDMVTQVRAARLLCLAAGQAIESSGRPAPTETSVAKYFASSALARIADDAVQLHGANGCGPDYPVQRHLRDAKIMEIIEGSTQIHQLAIAQSAYEVAPP